MERTKRKQPDRIPVFISRNRFLAGSPLNAEAPQAPQAQTPPQAAQQKVVKLKPTQIKPPACPHGVQLTDAEFTNNLTISAHSKKKLTDDEAEAIVLRNSACIECNPVCEHGEPMNEKELADAVASGTRFSSACPACTNSTDYEAWDRLLNRQGFRFGRGMSPAKFVIRKPDGTTHFAGHGKNFETGNSDIERRDVNSRISRDDEELRSRATKPKGWGPESGSAGERTNVGTSVDKITEIEIASLSVACDTHKVNFCKRCFTATEIQNMKDEIAEAKQTAKRERQVDETDITDAEEFETPDPEIEDED